jgi:hypothetical protein
LVEDGQGRKKYKQLKNLCRRPPEFVEPEEFLRDGWFTVAFYQNAYQLILSAA